MNHAATMLNEYAAFKRGNEVYKRVLRYLATITGNWCIYPDKEIEHVGAAVVRNVATNALLRAEEQEDE